MKAIGLTNTQFFIAIIIGVLISIAWVAVTAPHPVNIPVQVITPVPTPPPVVITQQPVTSTITVVEPLSDTIASMWTVMFSMWWLLVPMTVLWFLLQLFRRDDWGGRDY